MLKFSITQRTLFHTLEEFSCTHFLNLEGCNFQQLEELSSTHFLKLEGSILNNSKNSLLETFSNLKAEILYTPSKRKDIVLEQEVVKGFVLVLHRKKERILLRQGS
jgi:hypothetical protein